MRARELCSIILFCLVLIASPLPNFSHRSYSDNLYEKTKIFLKEHPEQINILDSWGLGVLHRAVRNNNIRGVKLLIKGGADVNLRGILEITPLHFAANKGNLEISKLLVSNRARINPVMSNGWSPLHVAASKGNCSILEFVSLKKGSPDVDRSRIFYLLIKFLLSKGAEPNLSDKQGNTPFHSALIKTGNDFDYYFRHASEKRFREIQKNKMKTPKKTQKSIPYPNVGTPQIFGTRSITFNYKDLTGLKKNHIDILEIMKMNGADINAGNNKGFTPLHIACKTKYFNFNYSKDNYVSKWLLDNGADVNARDTMGNTPVFFIGGDAGIFNLLKNYGAELSIQNNNGETPVFYLYGKPEEILLNSGININRRDNNGYTLIHKAAEKLNIKKCRIFIAKGADINAASKDGTTPLIVALKNTGRNPEDTKKVLQLLDLGTSVNHSDYLGNTPLHYAVSIAGMEVYEKILKKGGKVNILNSNGETPLYKAVIRGRYKAAIFLLEQNADPNIGTDSGDTPLLSAVRGNSYSLVTELINKGADVNTPGRSGKPPLEVAADSLASAKIIKKLKRKGARKSPELERKEFRRDLRIFLWRALEITVITLGAALFFAGLILIFSSLKRDPETGKIRFTQPSRIILAVLYLTFIIAAGLNLIGRADILEHENIGILIIITTVFTPIITAGQLTFLLKKIKSRPLGWFLLILLILGAPCASDLMFLIIIIGWYQGEAGTGIGYWILIQSGLVLLISIVANLFIWLKKMPFQVEKPA